MVLAPLEALTAPWSVHPIRLMKPTWSDLSVQCSVEAIRGSLAALCGTTRFWDSPVITFTCRGIEPVSQECHHPCLANSEHARQQQVSPTAAPHLSGIKPVVGCVKVAMYVSWLCFSIPCHTTLALWDWRCLCGCATGIHFIMFVDRVLSGVYCLRCCGMRFPSDYAIWDLHFVRLCWLSF